MKRAVILDMDIGSDDAIAIMMAILSGEFDILGICTEVILPIETTTENALKVLNLLQMRVPVYRGACCAMVKTLSPLRRRNMIYNRPIQVNGKKIRMHMPFNLPLGDFCEEKEDAASFYVRCLSEAEHQVTIVMSGPMTNLGIALTMAPEIVKKIKEIVIMGGGYLQSNVTSCAESNVFRDPEAAQKVLRSGAKITMLTLDATHAASFSEKDRNRIFALGNPAAAFTAKLIDERRLVYDATQPLKDGNESLVPIHDALCIAYLLCPKVLTQVRECRCEVDCSDGIADGQTIVDNRYFTKPYNVFMALNADRELFCDILCKTLAKWGEDNK